MNIKIEGNNSKHVSGFIEKIRLIQKLYGLEKFFYRYCLFVVIIFNINALYHFLIYGELYGNLIGYKILALLIYLFTFISIIYFLFIQKVKLKQFVKKADNYLGLSDRLVSCYEIIHDNKNWNGWNCEIISDTVKCLNKRKINLLKIFPHKFKKEFWIALISIVISILINIFYITYVTKKLQYKRYVKYLNVQAQNLNRDALILKDKKANLNVSDSLQRSAMIMKFVSDSIAGNKGTNKKVVLDVLSDTEKIIEKEISNSPEFMELRDISSKVGKISDTLQSHWKSVDLDVKMSESIADSTKGEGIGKTPGKLWQKEESVRFDVDKELYRALELVKKHVSGDMGNKSADQKDGVKVSGTNTGLETGSGISENAGQSAVKAGASLNKALIAPINFDGEIIPANVWIDAVPPDRRECVKKYFSFKE